MATWPTRRQRDQTRWGAMGWVGVLCAVLAGYLDGGSSSIDAGEVRGARPRQAAECGLWRSRLGRGLELIMSVARGPNSGPDSGPRAGSLLPAIGSAPGSGPPGF